MADWQRGPLDMACDMIEMAVVLLCIDFIIPRPHLSLSLFIQSLLLLAPRKKEREIAQKEKKFSFRVLVRRQKVE